MDLNRNNKQRASKLFRWKAGERFGFLSFDPEMQLLDIVLPSLSAECRIEIFSIGVIPSEGKMPSSSRDKGVKISAMIDDTGWEFRWVCFCHEVPVAYYLAQKRGFCCLTVNNKESLFASKNWDGVKNRGPSRREMKKAFLGLRR